MRAPSRLALSTLLLAGAVGALGVSAAAARVVMRPPPPRFDPRVRGEVVSQPNGPPAISGGTLLSLADGHRVLVADADRDRVLLVDLDASEPVVGRARLPRGAEPGRAVEDAAGLLHVVLRGSGEILDVDPSRPEGAARRAVCPMPRGIAYERGRDLLHVACRGGELVSLPAAGGAATRSLRLDRDLRDAVSVGDRLFVTQFRSAAVLVIDRSGRVSARWLPPEVTHDEVAFSNEVAWRAVALPDGKIAMLHQRASRAEIVPSFGGYGSFARGCDGIVRAAISVVGADGATEGPEIMDVPLPVDLAIEAAEGGGLRAAIVAAANQAGRGRSVVLLEGSALREPGCVRGATPVDPGHEGPVNAVAVAFASDHRLVVQQRDPAQLVVFGADGSLAATIELGGATTFDTGHAIFHAGTAGGIACASCHPEGADDGHVWRFTGIGARRTPSLEGGAGAAPFHWQGEMRDMRQLMSEVFEQRMQGARLDEAHVDAVEGWLRHVPDPRGATRDPAVTSAPIARGRAIFEGSGRCTECHAGPRRTQAESRDVGTGGAFQVPSLVGVGHRLPLMHDGCAATVGQRFDPACGGSRHGVIPTESAELSDLIAYLESL